MTPSRRQFLQTAAGAAALTITTSSGSFGNTHMLQVAANFPAPPGPDRLPPEWYQRKIKQVQAKIAERNLNAMVLLNAHNVVYATGYFHLPTERPLAVLIPASGDPALFVPGLESDQVKLWWIKDVDVYFDFPGPVKAPSASAGRVIRCFARWLSIYLTIHGTRVDSRSPGSRPG